MNLLAITPEAETLALKAARNDYYGGNVATDDIDEIFKYAGGDSYEARYDLMKKLMLMGHWGIFEHPAMSVHFSCSRGCMAQITRHRHLSFDIQSTRYVNFKNKEKSFHMPEILTGETNKYRHQGKVELKQDPEQLKQTINNTYDMLSDVYDNLVDAGVPPEHARDILPNGQMVNVVASGSIRAWLHVISMRGDGAAQAEIQMLADEVKRILEKEMPMMMDIWNKYQREIQRSKLAP